MRFNSRHIGCDLRKRFPAWFPSVFSLPLPIAKPGTKIDNVVPCLALVSAIDSNHHRFSRAGYIETALGIEVIVDTTGCETMHELRSLHSLELSPGLRLWIVLALHLNGQPSCHHDARIDVSASATWPTPRSLVLSAIAHAA